MNVGLNFNLQDEDGRTRTDFFVSYLNIFSQNLYWKKYELKLHLKTDGVFETDGSY